MEYRLVKSDDPETFVHSWRPDARRVSLNPPDHIPKTYTRRLAKQLTIKAQGMARPSDMENYPSRHPWRYVEFSARGHGGIVILSDVPVDDLRTIAVYVLEFEDMLSRSIGRESVRSGVPYRIKIYRDRADFRRFAGSHGAGSAMSFYAPNTYDIGMYFDATLTHENFQELLAHELTHAYMDIVWGTTGPLWFAEGMAEYFQHFTWHGDRAEAGAISDHQLEILRSLGQDPLRQIVPIKDFLSISRERMYGPAFRELYAQAWTVVHYLFSYHTDMIFHLLNRGGARSVYNVDKEYERHLAAMLKRG